MLDAALTKLPGTAGGTDALGFACATVVMGGRVTSLFGAEVVNALGGRFVGMTLGSLRVDEPGIVLVETGLRTGACVGRRCADGA